MNYTIASCVIRAAHAAGHYDITHKTVVKLYKEKISKKIKNDFEGSYGINGNRLSAKIKMLTKDQLDDFCNGKSKLINCKNAEVVERLFENFDDLFRGYGTYKG